MVRISNRGNLFGIKVDKENHPHYIEECIKAGYDCKIDVWYHANSWMLGNDHPRWHVPVRFLEHSRLWLHLRNKEAVHLMNSRLFNYFWHENDALTYTSQGHIWTTHWDLLDNRSVISCRGDDVPPLDVRNNVYGLCSDFIGNF